MGKLTEAEAAQRLAIENGKPVNPEPLLDFRLCFYPERGYWRRTRSHRDEVPRDRVAREIGAPLELVVAWEEAAKANAEG